MENETFRMTLESFYDVDKIHCNAEKALELLKDAEQNNNMDSSLTEAVFFIILNTPNYKKQVALIDAIISCSSQNFKLMLLNHTISNFWALPTDRKDKFYYLIGRTFNILGFRDILAITDLEIQEFIWSRINADRSIVRDWDDDLFLEFLTRCKPFVASLISKIKIPRNKVQKYIDLPMNPKNRATLYGLFK